MYKPEHYKIQAEKDPLEKYITDPIHRKTIWWLLDFISSAVVLLLMLLLIYLSATKRLTRELGYSDPITIIFSFAVIILAISTFYYKKNNLLKKTILKLCSQLGIKITKKYGRIIFGNICNGTIKTASYIEHNFFTFLIGPFVGFVNSETVKNITSPDYMNQTSQVNLFCLISTPFNIKLSLQPDNLSKQEIKTECQEINYVVAKYLKNGEYYNWRIVLNKEYLTLQIVGGAWQGELFARSIEIGLGMFKELVNEMKGKYLLKDWKNYDIYWDKSIWQFQIKKRVL